MDEQLILPEDPRAKYIKVSYKGVEIFCTGIIIKGNMCEWEN